MKAPHLKYATSLLGIMLALGGVFSLAGSVRAGVSGQTNDQSSQSMTAASGPAWSQLVQQSLYQVSDNLFSITVEVSGDTSLYASLQLVECSQAFSTIATQYQSCAGTVKILVPWYVDGVNASVSHRVALTSLATKHTFSFAGYSYSGTAGSGTAIGPYQMDQTKYYRIDISYADAGGGSPFGKTYYAYGSPVGVADSFTGFNYSCATSGAAGHPCTQTLGNLFYLLTDDSAPGASAASVVISSPQDNAVATGDAVSSLYTLVPFTGVYTEGEFVGYDRLLIKITNITTPSILPDQVIDISGAASPGSSAPFTAYQILVNGVRYSWQACLGSSNSTLGSACSVRHSFWVHDRSGVVVTPTPIGNFLGSGASDSLNFGLGSSDSFAFKVSDVVSVCNNLAPTSGSFDLVHGFFHGICLAAGLLIVPSQGSVTGITDMSEEVKGRSPFGYAFFVLDALSQLSDATSGSFPVITISNLHDYGAASASFEIPILSEAMIQQYVPPTLLDFYQTVMGYVVWLSFGFYCMYRIPRFIA